MLRGATLPSVHAFFAPTSRHVQCIGMAERYDAISVRNVEQSAPVFAIFTASFHADFSQFDQAMDCR
jgi:hypothetical protein